MIPIPKNNQELLESPGVNFSLYSPRMVEWNKVDKLKTDVGTMQKLYNKSKNSFKSNDVKSGLDKKHKMQESILQSMDPDKCIEISTRLVSPFITGLGSGHPTETGMILDRNLGLPYIPASSIKGVLRLAHAINLAKGKNEVPDYELSDLFGGKKLTKDKDGNDKEIEVRGQLVIFDAYPKKALSELKVDIMNPHFGEYYKGANSTERIKKKELLYQPIETETPNPIKFLAVPEGTEFVFRAFLMTDENTMTADLKNQVEEAFKTAFEKVGFGGKTAIGYGRFKWPKIAQTSEPSKILQTYAQKAEQQEIVMAKKEDFEITFASLKLDKVKNGTLYFVKSDDVTMTDEENEKFSEVAGSGKLKFAYSGNVTRKKNYKVSIQATWDKDEYKITCEKLEEI